MGFYLTVSYFFILLVCFPLSSWFDKIVVLSYFYERSLVVKPRVELRTKTDNFFKVRSLSTFRGLESSSACVKKNI